MPTRKKKKTTKNVPLTRAMLRQATNRKYFERGEEYFEADTVHSVKEKGDKVYATVHGTHPYRTTLWLENGEVTGTCTCPLGQDHEFCKHLVANGLSWIESKATKNRTTKPIEPDDLEAWLGELSTDKLVEIIMTQAMTDDEFYSILKFQVAAESLKPNTAQMRASLHQAMVIDDFVSWRETYDYSSGVERVIAQLRNLLDDHPGEVVELVEYAMELWEEAIQSIDDSDGGMGMILDDLHKLHLLACKRAKPDSVKLSISLFNKCVNSDWDMFRGAYETYGALLGKTGKARYRKLAEEEWRKLPRIGPGKKNPERYGRSGTLESIMLAFAEDAGDLDGIIQVMRRDLSESYDYLNIAQRCKKARSYDLARQWAEQGLQAFPAHHDTRLHEFLADEYFRAKRSNDALGLIWETFEPRPSLDRYQCLARYAKKAKTSSEWREKALEHIRKNIAPKKRNQGRPRSRLDRAPDHSLLVEIFLWEKDARSAWAEAQEGGCAESLWLQLAKTRETDHPQDAALIYRRQIEPLLRQKNNQSYENAVDYLGQIHAMMIRIHKESEFKKDLLAIKTEWKRLRNFIKYVERKKWGKID